LWKVVEVQYTVGPFHIDAARRRLFRDRHPVPLMPKVFELLLAFVERPGELLTKDALLQTLWPDITVEENNLTHAVAKLRRALGDTIHERRFIVTVPGQGYRLVVPVRREVDQEPALLSATSRQHHVTRLMILPFKLLRAGDEYDFLAFSVPDAMTSSLSGFEAITVRSSATAARFASEPLDLSALATVADVDAVLHGTLLHDEGGVRVNAQLVHVPDGTVLWSGMAQAPREGVFRLQDTLTHRILQGLAVQLTPKERRRLDSDVPANGLAYRLYLRANALSADARHVRDARDLYLQSIEADPMFAPAWARLGRIHRVIGKYENENFADANRQAEAAFKRALELSPDLPLAHGLYAYLEADLGRGSEALVRLLRHSGTATDPELLAGVVHVCRYCGLLDESIAAHERARRLDPIVRTSVAQTHWTRRAFQEAFEADSDNPSYVTLLAVDAMGCAAEAIALVNEALRRPNLPHTARLFLPCLRAVFEGNREDALAAIEACRRVDFPDPEAIYRLGWILARLREDELALRMLRRAVDGGFTCPTHVADDPAFDHLRGHSAFAEILNTARQRQAEAQAVFAALGGYELIGSPS
jgi:DNA-binding winged helix-turn-helix (wHTH) protein/tetratricopeptide (TPR) repeat protein